jgi:hypothetical protein
MSDVKNLQQLLHENKETYVIDVLDHVLSVDEDPYMIALKEPVKGIYLPGSIDPIVRADSLYYPKSKLYEKNTNIKSIDEIFDLKEDLVDREGKVVLSYRDLKLKAKYLKREPTVPAVGVKMAIGVVLHYLNNLYCHTHVNTIPYRLENFIKKEYMELYYSDAYSSVFENLLEQVMNFIGKDYYFIYFYRVKGTCLFIEKCIDYRIYKYYEMTLRTEDED